VSWLKTPFGREVSEFDMRYREMREVSWLKTPFGREVSLLLLSSRYWRLMLS